MIKIAITIEAFVASSRPLAVVGIRCSNSTLGITSLLRCERTTRLMIGFTSAVFIGICRQPQLGPARGLADIVPPAEGLTARSASWLVGITGRARW